MLLHDLQLSVNVGLVLTVINNTATNLCSGLEVKKYF